MTFKLETGTKPSVSHVIVYFVHMFYGKLLKALTKNIKYASTSANGFLMYTC